MKINITMENWKKEAISEIMNNFDFERVKKVMDLLEWTWATDRGTSEVPDLDEIKKTALECLEGEFSTGGFWCVKESKEMMSLHFSIEKWDYYKIK